MVSVIFKHQFCASFPRLLSAWASFGVLDRHVAIVRRLGDPSPAQLVDDEQTGLGKTQSRA